MDDNQMCALQYDTYFHLSQVHRYTSLGLWATRVSQIVKSNLCLTLSSLIRNLWFAEKSIRVLQVY